MAGARTLPDSDSSLPTSLPPTALRLTPSPSPRQHFTLNSENLQQLAMRLCSKARCLYNELSGQPEQPAAPGGRQRVTVPILEAVTDLMTSVKDIIGWLNTSVTPPSDRRGCSGELVWSIGPGPL